MIGGVVAPANAGVGSNAGRMQASPATGDDAAVAPLPARDGVLERRLALASIASVFIAGCAHPISAPGLYDRKDAFWSGRLALQVASEPPQAFFSSFELKGSAPRGELLLFTPIGSTFAALAWTPTSARLTRGSDVRAFGTVDELVQAATGASFPVTALFAWLAGTQATVAGWSADLSQLERGRLVAVRAMPLPTAELKVVLDRA